MEPHELAEFQPVSLTRAEVLDWRDRAPFLRIVAAEDMVDHARADWRVLTAFTFADSQIENDVFYILEPLRAIEFPTETDQVQIVNPVVAAWLAAQGWHERTRYPHNGRILVCMEYPD